MENKTARGGSVAVLFMPPPVHCHIGADVL